MHTNKHRNYQTNLAIKHKSRNKVGSKYLVTKRKFRSLQSKENKILNGCDGKNV